MNAVFSICMYSGNTPPQMELTEEQQQRIVELVDQLSEPCTIQQPFGLSALSTSHYLVYWENSFPTSQAPLLCVRAEGRGCIEVWRAAQSIIYADTVGLWIYLANIGGPLLQKHFEDCQKQMVEYQAKIVAGIDPYADLWAALKNK